MNNPQQPGLIDPLVRQNLSRLERTAAAAWPRRASLHTWCDQPDEYTSWTVFLSVFEGRMGATASSSTWMYWVPMAAGQWYLDLTYGRGTDRGIVSFTLDGTAIGSIDTYGATTNLSASFGPFTVKDAGWHKLSMSNPTKHASSTGFAVRTQHIGLRWDAP